eukprot:jgi/Tetstr1/440906/TSEL_029177.t1
MGRRQALRIHFRGRCMLPYMDDFMFFASSRTQAYAVHDRLTSLLGRQPDKGQWKLVQRLEYPGMEIDSRRSGTIRAPARKLDPLAATALGLIRRAKRDMRWLLVREVASQGGRAQFLFLAINPAGFYLRELHDVLRANDSWSGLVKITRQLRRDLEWWLAVQPQQQPLYLQTRGDGLHACRQLRPRVGRRHPQRDTEARGLWYDCNRKLHITYKELKAVRYAVLTFVRGRSVLLHEDNMVVVYVFANLTSRSPMLMMELRQLWFILDSNDISIRARTIKTTSNICGADRLSREIDYEDWAFNLRHFNHLDNIWGHHTIDRFVTMENARLTRYISRWRDPCNEATDSLSLSDGAWCRASSSARSKAANCSSTSAK